MNDPSWELQRQADAEMRERMRNNVMRVVFYWTCAFAALLASGIVIVLGWHVANPFVLTGTALSGLAAVALCYWLWLDRSDEMLECPDGLRVFITVTGWLAVVFFAVGYFV